MPPNSDERTSTNQTRLIRIVRAHRRRAPYEQLPDYRARLLKDGLIGKVVTEVDLMAAERAEE